MMVITKKMAAERSMDVLGSTALHANMPAMDIWGLLWSRVRRTRPVFKTTRCFACVRG
jgi:hypothetical protein